MISFSIKEIKNLFNFYNETSVKLTDRDFFLSI